MQTFTWARRCRHQDLANAGPFKSVRRGLVQLGRVLVLLTAFFVLGTTAFANEPVVNDPAFEKWMATLWPEAKARGISRAMFDAAFRGVTPDDTIVALVEDQPEHAKSVSEYLASAVSEERLDTGRARLVEYEDTLDAIEAKYDVDRHILVAIWGLESTYGKDLGSRNVIRSLATLASHGDRRADFWRAQLLAALQILQRGDITPDGMTGSWAGAMGHTQFIPTTYNAFAVDFDGNGRRDVWNSIPDALASAANYLKRSGWRSREPWGYEVAVPKAFNHGLSGKRNFKTVGYWRRLGATKPGGRSLDNSTRRASLIFPMGVRGPSFIVLKNFYALLRYNQATAYALSVGHLADRLQGAPAFEQSWPRDERALRKGERVELQQLLVGHGYATGGIDGIFGTQTRAAIRSYQRSKGLPADGFAGVTLLEHLRKNEHEASSHQVRSPKQ